MREFGFKRQRIAKISNVDLFFTKNWNDQSAILEDEEARHCAKVFRYGPGQKILLTDGKGHKIQAEIQQITRNEVLCRTLQSEFVGTLRDYELNLLIAPTKKLQRMEWMIEKVVEIGVDRIGFVNTFHSERRKLKLDRLQRIALAAMKQSQKFVLPDIVDIRPINQWLDDDDSLLGEHKFIAHLTEDSKTLKELLPPKGRYSIMIGPEGDFSEREIKTARENDWQLCSLGNQRLRTETAALVAVSYTHFRNMNT